MISAFIILVTVSFVAGVVIEPNGSETIHPSPDGNFEVICSYENVKTCGPNCFPVDIWIDGSNQKPTDGSFVFEVKDEPVTVRNRGNGDLDCEVVFIPKCETLKKEPPIPPNNLVDGCPGCVPQNPGQTVTITDETVNKARVCLGTYVGERTVLTSADCVNGFNALQLIVGLSTINVDEVITHPEYDENTKRNNLALLKLNSNVTNVEFPCICSKSPQDSSFRNNVFGLALSPAPCTLCSNFTETDVCTKSETSATFMESQFGAGLYVENELCGVFSSGTVLDGGSISPLTVFLDSSSGFTVVDLSSFYNWINENIDSCG